jgi:putative transposase
MALVERGPMAEWPLTTQARLLSLNRSSFYYRPAMPSVEELALKRRIDELYTAHPFSGVRRITVQLRRDGLLANHKAVARHMRELGLAGITPGPNLSKRQQEHAVYPYLLRGVTASAANHVWGIDITYIRLTHGWLYLVAVLDWYSRYVVSWELDQTLQMGFVLAATRRALERARPCIWNSDQGSPFTSPQYTNLLVAAGVRISMDGRGRAHDNIFVERLWRTVKYEEVYLHEYASPREARLGLTRYLNFYNQERPHQALGYQTPAEIYERERLLLIAGGAAAGGAAAGGAAAGGAAAGGAAAGGTGDV